MSTFRSHTGFVERAASAGMFQTVFEPTALVFRGNTAPDQAFRHAIKIELAAVAALTALQPNQNLSHHAQFVQVFGFAPSHSVETPWAEVVASPLQHCRAYVHSSGFNQVGDVFLDQLILQGNGVRGDNNPFFVGECPVRRGDEICQGFSCACASLDHQVLPLIEGIRNRPQHIHLL